MATRILSNALTRVVAHGAGGRMGIFGFRSKAEAQVTERGVRFPRTRGPRRYGPRR